MEGTFRLQREGELTKEAPQLHPGDVSVAVYENADSKADSQNADSKADSKVQFVAAAEDRGPYAGMGREMVLKYSDTPFYNRLRKALLAVFVIVWLGLLGGVIYLAVTHKSCQPEPKLEWWQTAQAYRVYLRSFQDTDGDGIGDLRGVMERIDYLKDIGVDVIWLSPFYDSPMNDLGLDVRNHKEVDALFGGMSAFEKLLKAVHDKAMKLVVDFIPNHTSDKHPWFISTVEDDEDVYVYSKKPGCPPNNWVSVHGSSMWSSNSKGCYLHQFRPFQPDLNYRNNRVKERMNEIVKFWLDKGVDGFRLDSVAHLYEDYRFADETRSSSADITNMSDYRYWNHTNTFNMPEVMDMVTVWRGIMSDAQPPYRFMAADVGAPLEQLRMYYGRQGTDGVDFPLNSKLFAATDGCNGSCMQGLVNGWLQALPASRTANWALGNENEQRVASRASAALVDAMNMLVLLLPGTAVTYYGEEIGLPDLPADSLRGKRFDLDGRDAHRTPMRWNGSATAGFCLNDQCSNQWLPILPNVSSSSLDVESQLKDLNSHLHVYKNVSRLRKERTFQIGKTAWHPTGNPCVIAFRRFFDGRPTYLVAINFCSKENVVNLASADTPTESRYPVTLAAKTGNVTAEEYDIGQSYDLASVNLAAYQGLVFTWNYIIDELI